MPVSYRTPAALITRDRADRSVEIHQMQVQVLLPPSVPMAGNIVVYLCKSSGFTSNTGFVRLVPWMISLPTSDFGLRFPFFFAFGLLCTCMHHELATYRCLESDQRRRLTHILPRSYRLRWLGAAVVFFSVTTLLGFADLKAWSLGGIFLTSIAVALAGVHVGSKVEPD